MDVIDTVRAFNRSYTRRIGVLSDSYLGAGRPLGPSRLLFELGAGPRRVRELRRQLDLDSGYLSRMLGQLTGEGLVAVEPDTSDRRQRVARLTPAGRRAWQRLDRRSAQAAAALVAPLPPARRAELAGALATAERLLRVATAAVETVPAGSAEARDAVAQYFGELDRRFPGGFDPGAGGAAADVDAMAPPGGAFLVARSEGEVLACGGLQRVDATTAEIKRMWVRTDCRGSGLGGRLLRELEAAARRAGHRRVLLDTNGVLVEAIAMYERAGYGRVERYNDNPYAQHWFAKDL